MTFNVKVWLKEYIDVEAEIRMQIDRLETISSKLYSVGSPVYSDMPKAPSKSPDKFSTQISKIDEIKKDVEMLMKRQNEKRADIENTLKKLKSAEQRMVIRMRYIDGEKWTDIADLLFCSKEDYYDRQESYMRRTYIIHGKALKRIAEIKTNER